ncbi:glutamine--fructose-6-phosphate transaminase (isomerizing) [Radicibacter daui]|uniref:glutamine--fructose-6-phosphate transaminase (isomerizing) n=1 Tax=Radicibacter daui TaxID=3064829 RepID=UPI004046FD8B
MCGIIGIVGVKPVASLLIDGLKRLEYRGYDSAGIATLEGGKLARRRAPGKLFNLEKLVDEQPIGGTIGIGHTRWATHGAPSENNAHPHATAEVAIVHNGIIENFRELKRELEAAGRVFTSDTDTEIVAHLVSLYIGQGMSPRHAAATAFKRLQGAFSLVLMFSGVEDLLIGARRGTPLAVGVGTGEMYLASDAIALAPYTSSICYLADGDWVEITRDGFKVYDVDDQPVERAVRQSHVTGAMIGKGNFSHFMQKEIYEQTEALTDTLNAFVHPSTGHIALPEMDVDFASLSRITIIACGTAYLAGFVAKYWLERIARIPVEIDIASEFRYREAPLPEKGLALFISQSGETLDTLEALRYCRRQGQYILSIVNVPESTIARESDSVLYTLAGPEIGVASTKAFTTQLSVLACLAIAIARARKTVSTEDENRLALALRDAPSRIAQVLHLEEQVRDLTRRFTDVRDVLYLGRGSSYPIALEGALKLKEISYIHAEGYAAGELKHGPIALIDESVPVVVVAPHDALFEKVASNVQEVAARGGRIILISDKKGIETIGSLATATLEMPEIDGFVAPILYAVPVQLLAYHTAVHKGTDVDQPRNLAKSVTVE